MLRPRVNPARLKSNLLALSKIGGESGSGVTRLAYTPEEAQARDWVASRFAELGLEVRLDAAGNLFATRAGQVAPAEPSVMSGSHVDTVPHGGRFDGAAGVTAALEVAHVLYESGILTGRPIEFVVFAAEESPRFKMGHRWGSRALSGQVTVEDACILVDETGVSLADAMRRLGLDPDRLATARRGAGEIAAFVELHIEQGTELAVAGVPVGIVTSITGTRRYRIELEGRADHSGGTPMGARRDALAAAAEVVLTVESIATNIDGSFVGTVTVLTVEPNAMNVVPGRATLGIDLRDIEPHAIAEGSTQLLQAVEAIGARRQVVAHIHRLRDTPPLPLSERVQSAIETSARRAGIPARRVPSHTGHDAASLAAITEAGMIFVRNPTGRSHSPDEWVEWDDLAAATQVLLDTVLLLAGVSSQCAST